MRYLLLFISLFPLIGFPQQRPHYTQYILNHYLLNPALTGIENYIDLRASYRNQWAGLHGAPVTSYFSIQGPLSKKDYRENITSQPMPGENPLGNDYRETYTAASPHHGLGLIAVSDHTGPISQYNLNVTYAYHLGLSPTTSIAAGFGAGIYLAHLNRERLLLENPSDPALNSTISQRVRPDLNAGLWLYAHHYFAGFSIQQIIPYSLSFTNDPNYKSGELVRHYFATAGYKVDLSEEISAIPSALVKFVNHLPPSVDTNVKLTYRNIIWVGGSYRWQDAFATMFGCNISYLFNFSYSYDLSTSGLKTVSRGTHEIVIGFLLNNHYRDTCPRNLW